MPSAPASNGTPEASAQTAAARATPTRPRLEAQPTQLTATRPLRPSNLPVRADVSGSAAPTRVRSSSTPTETRYSLPQTSGPAVSRWGPLLPGTTTRRRPSRFCSRPIQPRRSGCIPLLPAIVGRSRAAAPIGVVPFPVRAVMSSVRPSPCAPVPCTPIAATPLPFNYMPVISNLVFESGGAGIQVPGYGPMKVGTGLVVHCYECDDWGHPIFSEDFGSHITATFSGHTMTLHKDSTTIPPKRYVIMHQFNEPGLLCDDLTPAVGDVPAGNLAYNFWYLKHGKPICRLLRLQPRW